MYPRTTTLTQTHPGFKFAPLPLAPLCRAPHARRPCRSLACVQWTAAATKGRPRPQLRARGKGVCLLRTRAPTERFSLHPPTSPPGPRLVRRRFLYNRDYPDTIWEPSSMDGSWHWRPGSLIDPGFMMNKKSFGRPPPQVRAGAVSRARVRLGPGDTHAHQRWCERWGTVHPYSGKSRAFPRHCDSGVCALLLFPTLTRLLACVRNQVPHILPARPNPKKEVLVLPFLAGGPRGTSSQKVCLICACWAP